MLSVAPLSADHSADFILAMPVDASGIQQEIVAEVLAALQADCLDLPVLPEMALKIQKLIDDPDSSTDQFVRLIATDLTVSLCLIKAANSAELFNGHPVGNLYDAIPRLGYQMLYSMVMNIVLTNLFRANSRLIDRKLKELWTRSRTVAVNSYVLAQHQKHLKPEDAMLVGLVHEIGALPLYLYADRHHPEITPATLESLIATFSSVVGLRILQSWNFPEQLVDVVAEQLDLWIKPKASVADYVDVLAMAKLLGQETEKDFQWRSVPAAERLGNYPGDCKKFKTIHAAQFSAVRSMLGIDEG